MCTMYCYNIFSFNSTQFKINLNSMKSKENKILFILFDWREWKLIELWMLPLHTFAVLMNSGCKVMCFAPSYSLIQLSLPFNLYFLLLQTIPSLVFTFQIIFILFMIFIVWSSLQFLQRRNNDWIKARKLKRRQTKCVWLSGMLTLQEGLRP